MTMKLENPLRLKVALEGAELLEYGLTFDRLDYEQGRTKQLLNALLIKAVRTTDFRLQPGRLMIEAFPAENGGCVIYFTINRTGQRLLRRKENDGVYLFSATGELLDAIKAAYIAKADHTDSALFRQGNQWRLAVWGISRRLETVMHEFAEPPVLRRSFLLQTGEHGRLICSDAINVIGAAQA